MSSYLFEGSVVIEPLRHRRESEERHREKVNYDYEHHLNPLRGMSDIAHVRVKVETPRELETGERVIFENAMRLALQTMLSEIQIRYSEAYHSQAISQASEPFLPPDSD